MYIHLFLNYGICFVRRNIKTIHYLHFLLNFMMTLSGIIFGISEKKPIMYLKTITFYTILILNISKKLHYIIKGRNKVCFCSINV